MKYTTKTTITTISADKLNEYMDKERFIVSCIECPSYATRYSCPPFDFDEKEYLSEYKYAHFVLTQIFYDDETIEYCRGDKKRQSEVLFDSRMEVFDIIENAKVGKEAEGGISLASYSCNLCQKCRRPSGEACHKSDIVRYCISGFGFDVAKITEELFRTPLLWQTDTIPPYQCLVGMFMNDEDKFSLE